MQDPKQKALEIYSKFHEPIFQNSALNINGVIECKAKAKQCALIACEFAQESPCNFEWYNRYLEEVKQEIINL